MPGARAGSLRLFFGLLPDARVRRRIVSLRNRLNVSGREVPAANFHVTLAFLGSVPSSRQGTLGSLASTLRCSAGQVRLDRIGSFPRARVAWLGIDRPPAFLADFRARLVGGLRDEGFSVDLRRWTPHVTLYRKLRTPCENLLIDPVIWPVREFALLASETGPGGVCYRVKDRWSCGPTGQSPGAA
ncbi:RNA 2',3'-cyclic phosphodiesterase [Elongatibacter sediminis]|uniref:RNA 2',3'-cyclic phosphodiesterase n=1 Tax=Elongatibacter sediminis TaxID=3119006 RepID=A0AAW9R8C6_9GAMM